MIVPRYYGYIVRAFLFVALLGFFCGLSDYGFAVGSVSAHDSKITIVAHRGASGYAPENTLDAYRLAVRMRADYIEIDLQMTEDGELIAMHDGTVDRTTNGTGFVRNMTLSEIKSLDSGSWFNDKHSFYARKKYINEKVPTLREVFEAFGPSTRYLLETKSPKEYPGLEEKMWSLVQEFKLEDRIAVQSFSMESLKKIRKRSKGVPIFQLMWYKNPASISKEKLKEIGKYANGIGANFQKLDKRYVRRVKKANLLMYVYTPNFRSSMARALKWGVDGIHTDYPDILVAEQRQIENSWFASNDEKEDREWLKKSK
ncbi:glycerophosphodiester phosphodiesterase [Cohnella lupini]|nr:glycerophosphodiester phosphodiesterase [Cohnella lupini]